MFHPEQNLEDPLKEAPLLQYTCNGIKRSGAQPSKLRQREPITIPILHKLKAQLQAHRNFNRFDKCLLWAAFTLAFYGFLRGGELTTSSLHNFNPLRDLSVDDIVLSPDFLRFTIKQSKTDQFRQTVSRTIPATGMSTCPVWAMIQYLKLRSTHRKTNPLFIWHTGDNLTCEALSLTLKLLIAAAGMDPSHFSSRSFRIGAATTVAAVGLPHWLIQSLGRWRGAAYLRYIRTPSAPLINAARTIARATQPTCTASH